MTFKFILEKLLARTDLSEAEMTEILAQIFQGQLSTAQLSALIIAMTMKGETVDELFTGVKVLRQLATLVQPKSTDLLDIVGTGGDQSHTFNISTACTFVVAAAGVKIAKHGSTGVSSTSGSANVLEALGINIHLSAKQVAHCIDELGIGFMFAPSHHPAMRQVADIRKELGVRTIFNLLGPLTNPADAKLQMIGVFDARWLLPFAEVLQRLGTQHALVVHARDGMDEISINAVTDIVEVKNDSIQQFSVMPEDFGLQRRSLNSIQVQDAKESADIILDIFNGKKGAAHDILILNAGAALFAANHCTSIKEGVELANSLIESKQALKKLKEFINLTNQLK